MLARVTGPLATLFASALALRAVMPATVDDLRLVTLLGLGAVGLVMVEWFTRTDRPGRGRRLVGAAGSGVMLGCGIGSTVLLLGLPRLDLNALGEVGALYAGLALCVTLALAAVVAGLRLTAVAQRVETTTQETA